MFEEVLSGRAIEVVESLSPHLDTFYLAGGTALALQLGHRRSDDINFYHVLRSLIFFEDAEQEPLPPMVLFGDDWKWENIKSFFINNINSFERGLGS